MKYQHSDTYMAKRNVCSFNRYQLGCHGGLALKSSCSLHKQRPSQLVWTVLEYPTWSDTNTSPSYTQTEALDTNTSPSYTQTEALATCADRARVPDLDHTNTSPSYTQTETLATCLDRAKVPDLESHKHITKLHTDRGPRNLCGPC